MRRLMLLLLLAVWLLPNSAFAVYEKADGFPWNLTLNGRQDQPIIDALGGGFFMNVGPTGIRAQITHENPCFFTVRYVFADSPAGGRINPGDVILGANGHVMDVPHQFGRRTVTGWDGPMTEMARLIEQAQAGDGTLELIVWPGGRRADQTTVTIQIEAVGAFSPTFPFNCPRSDRLMTQLCDFLASEYDRDRSFGRVHVSTASILALMASGDDRYAPVIRDCISRYYDNRYDASNGGGFPCWGYGLDGIVMGEYYLLTHDQQLEPAMNSLITAMAEAQDPVTGGYMHRPYPFITNRIAQGGPKGYGAMSGVAGLTWVALNLFDVAGLPVNDVNYERMYQAYLTSVGPNGEIGYGFQGWDHAVLELRGDSQQVLEDARGIGYYLQTGMEGITQYQISWPTQADPRYRPTDWVQNEAARNRLYVIGENRLVAIRDMSLADPTGPYNHNGRRTGHIFRSGCGALGFAIGAAKPEHANHQFVARHLADSCANSPNAILDGHASTLLHTLYGSLGAAQSNEAGFRHYMDGMKWWFIMAQTHDGSFVCMPGRDYASTDNVYATRNFPTATAALILSVKQARLQITGAAAPQILSQPGSPTAGTGTTPTRPTTGGTTTARPIRQAGVDLSALGEGFSVVHCEREARLFDSTVPFARIFSSLNIAIAQGSEHGEEAAEFADRLGEWLTEKNNQVIEDALTHPARTLAENRDHVRRLAGLDEYGAAGARAMIERLDEDRNIRNLARYYEQMNRILGLEEQRGATAATTRSKREVATLLGRFVQDPALPPRLAAEARDLLAQLEATIPPEDGQ